MAWIKIMYHKNIRPWVFMDSAMKSVFLYWPFGFFKRWWEITRLIAETLSFLFCEKCRLMVPFVHVSGLLWESKEVVCARPSKLSRVRCHHGKFAQKRRVGRQRFHVPITNVHVLEDSVVKCTKCGLCWKVTSLQRGPALFRAVGPNAYPDFQSSPTATC